MADSMSEPILMSGIAARLGDGPRLRTGINLVQKI